MNNSFEATVRVDGPSRLTVEWPLRLTEQSHNIARGLIGNVHGVDMVASTQYREIVQLAPHVTISAQAAQEVADALQNDSGDFKRIWRGLGYDDINVSVLRW